MSRSFGESFSAEVQARLPTIAPVRIPATARRAMAGRSEWSGAPPPNGDGSASPSGPDFLYGEAGGRCWEISPFFLSPLPRWFWIGPNVLRISTWFRAAPPGGERARATPWFLFGRATPLWRSPTGGIDERRTERWARERVQRPLATVHPEWSPWALVADASYGPLASAFAEPIWEEWYHAVHSSIRRGWFADPPAPILVGRNGRMTLFLGVSPHAPAAPYAEIFTRFVDQAANVERGFEAPPLTEAPFTWRRFTAPTGYRWPLAELLYRCPRCGNEEAVAHVTAIGRPWRQFLVTAECRAALFGDAPDWVGRAVQRRN